MAKRSTSSNPLAPPSVSGLEGSRRLADKRHRRKKRKDRISSTFFGLLALAFVAGAGYVGYTVYVEQQDSDREERERRVAELEAERQQRTTDDLIVDLQERPRWNGPGTPAFGVGDGTFESIDVVEPTDP